MTRLGVIARCDDGGLGVQTVEYVRHLKPDAVMLVMVDPPRGVPRPGRIGDLAVPEVRIVNDPPLGADRSEWALFIASVDVVFTAETWYHPDVPAMCEQAGVRLVVHANPELWQRPRARVETWVPTAWEFDRMPDGTMVVPMPVDRDRLAPAPLLSRDGRVRRVLHISAPAMLDRNGTDLIEQAIGRCTADFTLVVAGPRRPDSVTRDGRVTVEPVERVDDYARLYDNVDALVLPRRYGGLCLPMQEAASRGLPIVSLDLEPQRVVLHPDLLVHAEYVQTVDMKGGGFPIHGCDRGSLARTLDKLVTGDPAPWVDVSERWAGSLDWRAWAPRYQALLRGAEWLFDRRSEVTV